jgi:hypothetical protein
MLMLTKIAADGCGDSELGLSRARRVPEEFVSINQWFH